LSCRIRLNVSSSMLFTYANNPPTNFIFLFIHNHLILRKWCYTPLQHDFALDPIILPFDFHFRIYKRDFAILTEWWQQRIAWWIRCFSYVELSDVPRF
jgi:hypothetical protein